MEVVKRFEREASPFATYMRLQAALYQHWCARGGTSAGWQERMAPAYRKRYGHLIEVAPDTAASRAKR
jgi:hypothetical protein